MLIRTFEIQDVSNSEGSGDSGVVDDFNLGKGISHDDLLSGNFEIDKKPQN